MTTNRFVIALAALLLTATPSGAVQQSPEEAYLEAVHLSAQYPAWYFNTLDKCVTNKYAEIPAISALTNYKRSVQEVAPVYDPMRPKEITDEQIVQEKLRAIAELPDMDKKRPNFKLTEALCKKLVRNYAAMQKIYKVD